MAVTLCTRDDLIGKAGTNVSVSGVSVTYGEGFINQAEGYINARTRFNWVTNYASLAADVKSMLKFACSNLAAMYAIQFDMSGYASRVTAETMLDVLRDGFVKAMEALENINVKEYTGVK